MGRPKKIITPPIKTVINSKESPMKEGSTIQYNGSEFVAGKTTSLVVDKIMAKYLELCDTESDINELLPILFDIASEVSHVTEFGVRIPTSTYALLAAKPKRVVSYDIGRYPEVDEVERLCDEAGQDFEFVLQNVLGADIEETDFLFIDSYHSYNQAKAELGRHAHKVKKFLGWHDWGTHFEHSESWYPGVADFMNCPEGIGRAVYEFLENNKEWSIYYETKKNNGLIVLKRN